MDFEKSDKLGEASTIIDESFKLYYSDVFTPGETKEQLEIGKEVKGSLTSVISDTAYGVGWDGDTTHAPTKNTIYDKIELLNIAIVTLQSSVMDPFLLIGA